MPKIKLNGTEIEVDGKDKLLKVCLDQGAFVSEQWLLDMERKAFLELLNHPKTQERIMGMMQTGKPVRN